MIYDVTIGEQTLKVRVERAETGYTVQVGDGPQRQVDARWVRDHLSMVFDDQRSFDVPLARAKDGWHVGVRRRRHDHQTGADGRDRSTGDTPGRSDPCSHLGFL